MKPTANNIATRLDMIRDNNNETLQEEDRKALIIASNVVRSEPAELEKYIDKEYKDS